MTKENNQEVFFCVKVTKNICSDEEIYLKASYYKIEESGALLFYKDDHMPLIGFSQNTWNVFYLTSDAKLHKDVILWNDEKKRLIMEKKPNIICDCCKLPLNESSGVISYRLDLSSKMLLPVDVLMMDINIHPDIDKDMHFCGIGCLQRWLEIYETP